jgi:putative oxidoreductase
MTVAKPETKLLLPFLQPFYDVVSPLSWLIIRLVVGIDLSIHGWEKVVRIPSLVESSLHDGSQPGLLRNLILVGLEFVGGICIAVGLFTRFFAAATAIEMAIITFTVFWPKGYHAYEYTLWWGLVLFAIALRGGGPYSLDQRLGREL